MILTQGLINALENTRTPNDILLTILNLIEFIERRNVNLFFIDYNQFGKVAYKCRAFAKALYYKEKDFLFKSYTIISSYKKDFISLSAKFSLHSV